MLFKRVTHVLFDLDGLLIDSEKHYAAAYTTVCSKYGKEFTWELNKKFLGCQARECAEMIINELNLPISIEHFMEQCAAENEEELRNVQLMPGAKRLVEHLHKNKIPMAIATSSSKNNVDVKMRNSDILDKFHHVTMGSSDPEVTKGKPDPCIFLVCASRFPDKPKPENCLVLEDALNGMKAAIAANMQVVVVPDPRLEKELFTDATQVLTSLEHFQPELFGLPPF